MRILASDLEADVDLEGIKVESKCWHRALHGMGPSPKRGGDVDATVSRVDAGRISLVRAASSAFRVGWGCVVGVDRLGGATAGELVFGAAAG